MVVVQPQRPQPGSSSTTSTTKRPAVVQPSGGSTSRRPVVSPSGTSTARPLQSTTPGRGEVEDDDRPSSTRRPTAAGTSSTRRPGGSGGRPSKTTTTTSRRPRPVVVVTSSTTTSRPIVKPPPPVQPSGQFECRSDGMFADPRNCRKFIRCVSLPSGQYQRYNFDCAPGTAFNEAQGYCDHIYNVPSCNKLASAPDDDRQSRLVSVITSNHLDHQQQQADTNQGYYSGNHRVGATDARNRQQHFAGYFSNQFTVHHQW